MTSSQASRLERETTLVLIKPDGVARGLTGQILARFERVGLELVALKKLVSNHQRVKDHFPNDIEWIKGMGRKTLETYRHYNLDPVKELGTDSEEEIGGQILGWNVEYLRSGPVVAVAVRGLHAVDVARKMIGDTLPYRAAPGTVRGDFSTMSPAYANAARVAVRNLVHASGNAEEAIVELANWFTKEEMQAADEK